jgi:polysaccharide pyruvyl transferase CsaB
MKGVLFSGFYGFGNAGDEAVLAASLAMFRERRPDLPLAVLSADPRGTARDHGVSAIRRMRPAALGAVRRAGLFLSGGGSLLQDRTSLQSLVYYLFLLRAAQTMGVPTMIFAQGIGPLIRPAARRLTARVLQRARAITVRDAESADLLRRIGVTCHAEVTADPVFALPPTVTDRVTAAAAPRPVVGVSVRSWPGIGTLLPGLAEALGSLPAGVQVQLWPLFPEEDTAVCAALQARVPGATLLTTPLTPGEWMALAGWSDAVLAMRLHALIFGAARGVPVAGISYDPKVDALLARLHGALVGTAEHVDPDRVRQALLAALDSPESARRDREARAEQLRTAAGRNAERALMILKGN